MTQEEIDKQIKSIKEITAKLLAEGKEACLKFLIDAGIVKK